MLSNLSNNNAGNSTKSVVEKKKYEDIEKRIDEMQEDIDATAEDVSVNSQAISNLNDRVDAVEDNSTFPELNTDTINPATGDKVEITSDLDVDGEIEANSVKTNSLSVNGTNFTTVKDDAAQAKSTAENAKNKADEAYDLADAVADELADYKADNEQSFTTGTLNADSVVTDSIAAQTINTNDFETTNAEIDKLYVDTIKATGFLELPTAGQQYYTITIPAKTTASFSGVYTSDNNTDYPFYFTVSDGAVIYKQNSTEIIKDISFDRETGYTKVRVKTSTNLTYISSALDNNPVTIEDGGDAYADYVFIPQKTGGYLIRGYDDTTTEVYIAGVLRAYAMSVEEEIIERTSVDFLKVNASIELPKDWDAGGTISYSTGEENQYISAQTKAGVKKPTWTSPIHSTIGSLSYSSKLVDEATVASYKGISETRQTQTISITDEASLQQLTAFHWTKNGNYWQPYETTRITIGDHTMWIDPTESNQGIRFYDNQVIADGTWNDVPVEEANAVPVNLVIFDAPTELSFPITNLGDKTTVHGEITATCFKGNVLGNVTGNADTATNATCFNNKTYAEACADILSGCAADSNKFNNKTYSEACADILSGNAATATNATCFDGKTYSQAKEDILSGCAACADNTTCFGGCTYSQAKADILSGNAASATNATCFNGCTYSQAKTDILSGNAASATNATCFGGCTYSQAKADILSGCAATADNATCFNGCTYACAKADILSGTAAQAHCVDIDSLTTNSYPLVMESTTCELGKSGTCSITFTPSSGILETTQVSTTCIENSGTTKSQYLCATCDINVDGNAYITGDLTVQGTITTAHSEEVVTPSENIILRDSATTPVASGCYSGFTVTNYDGQNHNLEVGANSDGTLHVGVVGGTMEPVATRATEACMENGYATHWDSTGTDLVTKGATNTHDLTVNGNASVTGCLSVTGNTTVTGTLTADLTGTADNATKFSGCTYAEACADILSGNAATATNATCFDGCTYAEACADILSGCASEADNATCFGGCTYSQAKTDILSGCAADSAKLGNKDASCYIDNSSTGQTKAGNLSIGAPAACTPTSAGGTGNILGSTGIDIYGSTSLPHIHFHNNKYCGEYSARIASTTGRVALTVNNGTGCTAATESKIFDFCSNGTFTGATNICGTNIYQSGNKVIDTSSTAQTKAGDICIGAPANCTSTSAGGTGTHIRCTGGIELFHNTEPYIQFHAQKYCGDYSASISNSYSSTDNTGRVLITVTDGYGCTPATSTKYFNFKSDGTFTGASTICASTNIYSAGCPVVTTGTLPTVAPGYNCTGTSNYVVTTKVCCAEKADCIVPISSERTDPSLGICALTFFGSNTYCGRPIVDDAYWFNYLTMSHGCGNTYYATQIAMPFTGSAYHNYYRQNRDGTWTYWYQLIDSTGGQTINGNLTIPTACGSFCGNLCGSACTVRRTATHNNATCQLALLGGCTSTDGAGVYVSDCCPISYNPSTGVLTACAINNSLGQTLGAKNNICASSLGFTTCADYSLSCVIATLGSCYGAKPGTYTFRYENATSFNIVYDGSKEISYNTTIEKFDDIDTSTGTYKKSIWQIKYSNGTEYTITDTVGGTAGTHTYKINKTSKVANSVCNTPSAASTTCNVTITAGCCNTTAATNYTWCFCGCNGVFRSPSDIYVGTGSDGTNTMYSMIKNGGIELSSSAPALDFHFNCYCGNFSSRLINNAQGQAQLIVNDGTGTTAATQTGTYTFCSDGTVLGICTGIMNTACTACVNGFNAATNNYANLKFQATCCDATTRCNWNMCLCGCNGKLYNPQGFVGSITGNADTATNSTCFGGCTYAQAKEDIAGSVETTEYTCINDVNSGSQDILMTSSTGTLGIVNASTGTNACPLKFNSATGVLSTCKVEAKSFKPTCYSWSQCITGIKLDGTTLCVCLA